MSRLLRVVLMVGLTTGASIGGVLSVVAPASAAVNGHCGDVVLGTLKSGDNLREGGLESPDLQVYTEVTNHTLAVSVAADFSKVGLYHTPANLPSPRPILVHGTSVNSYLLHSDPVGHPATQLRTATLSFTTDIVGVQILSSTLVDANGELGASGVHYPGSTSGLELAAGGNGDFAHLINARTLAVSFKTSNAIDDVRIITRGTSSLVSALNGYRILAADGGVFDFGGQQFYGSTGGRVLNQPIVSGTNTCGNAGYWFVARDGGVFSYGDAQFHGSLGGSHITSPVVAFAETPTGAGYYLVQANGAVHAYGDAAYFHDLQFPHAVTLNKPIVGMMVSPTGKGYYLVASDGGVFRFGDAANSTGIQGSLGNLKLVSPIVGIVATSTSRGFYLYAADGGIFSFGDAKFHGSVGGTARTHPIVGMRATATGAGYFLTDSAGTVYHFGDAHFAGDMSNVTLFRPMIGMM